MEESWDPVAKSEKSETFCILPWVHQYIGAQGDVKPCCIYQHKYELGNLKNNSLEEIFNNEETKKLRLDMLNGVKRPECKECTLKEGVLRSTLRNSMNSRFTHKSLKQSLDVLNQLKSTQPDGTVSTHKLFYMDVRFNNLCNFKCMTCSPVFSSSLIEEFNLVYNTKYGYSFAGKTEEDVFEQMRPHIPNLTNIYFAGGEPMMQKEHYQTLIECIEVQNFPDLSYNTNLSRLSLGKYDVIQLWKYFPRVAVMASLDGNYERAEYWRKETNWNKILENRYRIKNEAPNVGFVVACTVTWVNIFNILDFHKEWYELGLVDLDKFNLNPTYGPEFYSLVGLPKWKKNRVCHAINNHIDWIQTQNYNKKGINLQVENATKTFQGLLKFVNEDAPELDAYQFHRVVSKFDGMRNNSKSFFEVFTEHKDMEEYFNSKGYFFEKNLT